MKKTVATLQKIVNEISEKLDGIDSPDKMREAEKMAQVYAADLGQMTTILIEALRVRECNDTDAMVKSILKNARQSIESDLD